MQQAELPRTGVGKRKANRYVVGVLNEDAANGELIADKVLGSAVTYQWELVKCGKAKCRRCAKRPSHGPYLYAYWSDGGKTRQLYIGKIYRPALEVLVRRRTNNANKGSEHDDI